MDNKDHITAFLSHISENKRKTKETHVVYKCKQEHSERMAIKIKQVEKHLLPVFLVYPVNSTWFLRWKSSKRKLHYCISVCAHPCISSHAAVLKNIKWVSNFRQGNLST